MIWERYDIGHSMAGEGVHTTTELFYNKEDTDNFQNADVVVVDGIATIITDTDDLCGVRLVVAHDSIVAADIDENTPGPQTGMVYYTWYAARGPLVFRLRSKKTIPPFHKLWANTWKARGTTSTQLRAGFLLALQLKH